MFTEAYLEPSSTSAMEFFCEKRLVAVKYFCKSAPL